MGKDIFEINNYKYFRLYLFFFFFLIVAGKLIYIFTVTVRISQKKLENFRAKIKRFKLS